MSGIYFHIPFCKVKCSYCDFYKTTNISKMSELVSAIKLELWLRKDYLADRSIKTIYFGGGTPSLLSAAQIDSLLKACFSVFDVQDNVEITMEANPDDLNLEYLQSILKIGINRLSIGVQSFSQTDLMLMKRRHNPIQAKNAVKFARQAGFKNISVDLIYGVPSMPFEQWKANLNEVFKMDVQHISAYHLTYHQNTQLWNDLKKGKIQEIEETESVLQFNELTKQAKANNFIHYEISNFSKEVFFSQHNSSYWNQTDYLGLGPSAHSYDKKSRQWNVSSLTHYLLALSHNKIPFESEILEVKERFNDYMITSLRTMWGIDLEYVLSEFGQSYVSHVKNIGKKYSKSNQVILKNNSVKLAQDGMFVSDTIMSEFML
ncbi:MAG: radical SAM family heme chaperone HemW [Prolixibacteraceae bacterium]|jgi:oxygen-independent coproporphyrinogen-3 oxidase|nr:radical SAM family heme chaperone HemW [Prolixibacteraceae bacterium]